MSSTLGANLNPMILHGKSVMRVSSKALVVVDLPFGSYESSPRVAVESASRILQETGCSAVKLEGATAMAETIEFLSARGIPVMAHIGLMPQSVMTLGGFKVQGRDEKDWPELEAAASAVANAGAFAVVLEGTVEPLAARITKALPVPTIGIGASSECDGQVLVLEDMLGLSERVPRFVRRFGELGVAADKAISAYAAAVRDRSFPNEEEVYRSKN
jgi:3-methyl-2-oxobutanoate hydroxymethyltransferase